VLDGRDIGTVIAPGADAKLFVTAAPHVRAKRRLAELRARGMDAHEEEVLADIRARDARDSGRVAAPLVMADDAMLLDTSELGVEEAVAEALRLVAKRILTKS
jgi:cytidylate kinase